MKLSFIVIAALFTFFAFKAANEVKADVEVIIDCHCGSPSPTVSPTPTATATATPTVTPIPSQTPLSCPPDYHLDASGKKCVQFELGGPPSPPDVKSEVLGVSTTLAATSSDPLVSRIALSIIGVYITSKIIKKYNI